MSVPLLNRGPEALVALLNGDRRTADDQVRLLNLTELTHLAHAATMLAVMARRYTALTCQACGGMVTWNVDAPAGESPWLHAEPVDPDRAHRPVVIRSPAVIRDEAKSDRYMMATKASHGAGDISRDEPGLCVVDEEYDEHYVGEWVTGFGFINVKFPKATTRELTEAEKEHYRTKTIEVAGLARPILIPCCDLHNQHCEPPSELCCRSCTEAGHPQHPRGVQCVLDTLPQPSTTEYRCPGSVVGGNPVYHSAGCCAGFATLAADQKAALGAASALPKPPADTSWIQMTNQGGP